MVSKNLILQAAILQIRERGYENLSLRRLAAAVDLTTGAFYKSFSSKQALFKEITVSQSNQLVEDFEKSLPKELPAKEELLRLASFLLTRFRDEPKLMDFLFFNPTAGQVFQGDNQNFRLFQLTERLIKETVATHPGINAQAFFIQIWSFIQGYALLITHQVTEVDETLIERTLDALIGGK